MNNPATRPPAEPPARFELVETPDPTPDFRQLATDLALRGCPKKRRKLATDYEDEAARLKRLNPDAARLHAPQLLARAQWLRQFDAETSI